MKIENQLTIKTRQGKMSYPKNEKEWWTSLEEHWENLMAIMAKFLLINPNTTNPEINHHMKLEDILNAKKNKDGHKLVRYLNDAWFAAPDKPRIHEILSWRILCDLCSESYVLDEQDETIKNGS